MTDPDWIDQAFIGTDDPFTLLVNAARSDLSQRVRYQLAHDQNTLPDMGYLHKKPIPQAAVRYLHVMLNGVHQQALHEWLITVEAMGYHPQIDVIQALLNWLASNQDEEAARWYQPIQRMLGADGVAAAQILLANSSFSAIQHNKLFTGLDKAYPQAQALSDAKMDELTATVQTATQQRRYLDPDSLVAMQRTWTIELTQAFFEHIDSPQRTPYILRYVDRLMYYFNLMVEQTSLDWLMRKLTELSDQTLFPSRISIVTRDEYRWLAQAVKAVLQFRRQMVQAIQTGK